MLADSPQSQYTNRNEFTGRRVRELWERVDQSLPLTLSGNQTWYVRILHHKAKGLMLDIRKFEYKTNGNAEWFEPSEEGLTLPVGDWFKLLDPLFKLLKKWKERIK